MPRQGELSDGVAWDHSAIWNVDTWDKLIYRSIKRLVRFALDPAPANEAAA
jgi:hypothetical protein